MPRPDAAPGSSPNGPVSPAAVDRPSASLAGCTPVTGPRRRPVCPVSVDDELVWVTAVPTASLGAARAPSPAAFVHLCVQLAQESAAAGVDALEAAFAQAELVDAAARAVAGYLEDLPDLPFVGEPFGGEEGTD